MGGMLRARLRVPELSVLLPSAMNSLIHRIGAITPMPASLRICFVLATAAALALPARVAADGDAASHHTFSLLPKSMQKNPDVHLSIITEMTVDGGKVRQP